MKANGIAQELFRLAGYTYEYPGYWAKGNINIADGESINHIMWEVQDGIALSAGPFHSAQEAIEWASKLQK